MQHLLTTVSYYFIAGVVGVSAFRPQQPPEDSLEGACRMYTVSGGNQTGMGLEPSV